MNPHRWAVVAFARTVVAMLALAIAGAPSARAATLTWWASGSTGSSGGTGTWDTTNARWTADGSTWSPWVNANIDTAVFAGTAGTVTLNTGITVGGLTFTTTGYTVTGNTLTLAGGTAAISLGSGISATIASTVSGTAVLQKTGAGTLTLSSANNYSGGTNLAAGILSLGNDSALGTGPLTFAGGTISPTANRVVSVPIVAAASTTSGLIFGGAGDLMYSGTATGSGTLVADSATSRSMWLQGDWSAFTGTIQFNVNGGGTNYRLGGTPGATTANTGTNGSNFSQAKFVLSGAGTDRALMWNGADGATVQIGELSGSGGRIDAGASSRMANWQVGSLNTSSTAAVVIQGATTALTKVGSGTLTLTGASTYSGTTTVNAGVLRMGNKNALGSFIAGRPVTQVTVNAGGAIDFNGIVDAIYGYTISGSGPAGAGAIVNNGGSIGNGAAQMSNLRLAADASIGGTGDFGLLTNSYGATSLDLNGKTLTKVGSNNFYLTNTTVTAGSNGAIRVSAGTVSLDAGAGGSGWPSPANLSGVAFSLDNVAGANLVMNSIGLSLGSLAGGGSTGGNVSLGSGTLTVGGLATTTTYSGSIGGTGGLVKTGTGTLTLSGANRFSGNVTVNAGTIRIGSITALGTPNTAVTKVVVNAGGAVDLNGQIDAEYGYTISGSGPTGAGALVNTGAAIGTGIKQTTNVRLGADAAIGGSGNWAILAAGYAATTLDLNGFTLTKTGANTIYLVNNTIQNSGTIAITQGTLALFNNPVSGTGATVVLSNTSGANLDLGGQNLTIGALAGGGSSGGNVINSVTLTTGGLNTSTTFGGAISGVGNLVKVGTGTMTMTGANTYSGATTISAGALEIGGSGVLNSGNYAGTITNTTSFIYSSSAAQTLSGAIGGPGNILKSGSGTLTLTGANTYTGTTTLTTGTLVVNGEFGYSAPIGSRVGNAVTIGSGATLSTGQAHQFGWNTSSMADVTINSGGRLLTNNNDQYLGNLVLNGSASISASSGYIGIRGDLTASPSGGAFATIATGSLFLPNSTDTVPGYNGGVHTFTVNDDGTLATDLTIPVATYGGGSLTKAGAGTLLLSASNAWSGGLALSAGAVSLGNAGALGTTGTISFGGGTLRFSASNTTDYSARFSTTASQAYSLDTNGQNVSVATALNSSGATLAKLGSGTLTLTANNTYAGNTTISAGVLRLGNGGAAGSVGGNVSVANGASLMINRSDAFTLSNVISGSGGLIQAGSGTTTLGVVNSYSGPTSVTGGVLAVSTDDRLGTAPGSATPGSIVIEGGVLAFTSGFELNANRGIALGPTVGSGSGTIDVATGQTLAYGGVIASNGPGTDGLIKTGAGVLSLTGAATYTGDTSVNAGTLQIGSGGSLASPLVTVASGATLSGRGTVNAVTVASGGILAPGLASSGTLTTGSLSFTGGATVTMGVSGGLPSNLLSVLGDVTPTGGPGSVVFAFGGSLANIVTGTYTLLSYTGNLSDASAFGFTGATGGRQSVAISGTTVANAVSLIIGNAFPIWTGDNGTGWFTSDNWELNTDLSPTSFQNLDTVEFNDLATSGTVVISGSNATPASTTFSGNTVAMTVEATGGFGISTGSVIKSGSALVTITNVNTYDGGTTLSAGRLRVGDDGALGTGAITVTGPAALSSDGGTGRTLANGLHLDADLTLGDATDNGNLTLSGTVTFDGASRTITTPSNVTLSGLVTNGGFTKAGAGVMTITGSNNYANGTTLSAGTLRVANDAALGGGVVTLAAGTLSSNDTTARTLTNAFTLTGDVTLGDAVNSGALTLGSGGVSLGSGTRQVTTASDVTFAGGLTSGGLTKTGPGTLTLAAAGSYGGGTTLSTGTLVVGNAGALGTGTFTFGGNSVVRTTLTGTIPNAVVLNPAVSGTFDAPSGNATWSGVFSGSGPLLKAGAGTVTLAGTSTYSGDTTISAGTLAIGGAAQLGGGSYAGAIANAGTLAVSTSANQTLAGVVSGVGSLSKSGAGTLTLSNASNSYSGGSSITGGVLSFANGALGTTGNVSVAGGTLRWATGNTQDVSSRLALVNSTTATLDTNGNNVSLAAGFGGNTSAALVKAGAGTLSLTGTTTFTGPVTVSAGVLDVGGAGLLGGGSYAGAITNSGTFSITSSAAQTLSGAIANAGTLLVNSAGNQIISGSISGAGAVTKSGAGTLTLSGNNSFSGQLTVAQGTLSVASVNNSGANGPLGSSTNAVILGSSGATGVLAYTGTTASTSKRFTLATGGTGGFDVATGITLTASGVISGSGGLVKSGAGTLLLSAANTYAGTTTINSGTVRMGNSLAFGPRQTGQPVSQVVVNPGGTVDFNGTIDPVYGYTISGSGADGTGALVNNGVAITDFIAQTSNVRLAGDAAIGGTANWGILTFGFAATTLDLNGFTLTKLGSNRISLTNTTILNTGTIVVASGTLALNPNSSAATTGTGAVIALANAAGVGLDLADRNLTIGALSGGGASGGNVSIGSATLVVGGLNTSTTFAGVISGGGNLYKGGTGTLTLTGASTWTGGLSSNGGGVVEAGTITDGTSNVGSGYIAIADSSTFRYTGATSATTSRVLWIDTGVGSSVIDVQNAATTLTWNPSGGTRNKDFAKAGAGTLALGGVISGTAAVSVTGGVLDLTAVNTFTGNTTITSGSLRLSGSGQLGSGAYAGAIANAGGLVVATSANQTLSGVISGVGSITKSGAGRLTLTNAANSFTGDIGITSGTLQVGGSGRLGSGAYGGAISNAGVLDYASSADQTLSGAITGVGSVLKSGGGALTLSASNAFSGGLTATAGTVRIADAAALGTGTVTLSGAALSSDGATARTIANAVAVTANSTLGDATNSGALSLSGGVSLGGGTPTLTTPSNVTIASAVSNGGLTKAGAGTLTLSASNSYAGATSINAGTLALSGNGDISAASGALVTIAAGATLDLSAASGARTIGALSDSGNVILGTNTLRSVVAGPSQFGGVISGAGGFTKAGTDQLELTSVQAFTGPASIEAGGLLLASGTTLASASRIYVESGATIETYIGETLTIVNGQTLGGYGTINSPLAIASGGILSPGGSVGTLYDSSNTTWNGGMHYLFEVNSGSGAPGGPTGWDLFSTTGDLTLVDGNVSPIVIDLTSLSGTSSGLAADFDASFNYAWKFAVAGSEITTFNPGWFTVTTSNFQNLPGNPERFYVARGNELPTGFGAGTSSELYIVYAAVPEPSTLALAGIGLAAAGWAAGRRRRRR